jgi:hypothetical protein
MGLHDEAKLDRKFVEFAKLMNVHLNHFPKHEKYGLALEIRRAAYEVYSFIVEAQKRYQKKTSLTNLDIRHEQLRMLVRLAYELGYFEFKDGSKAEKSPVALGEHRYLALSRLVDELGRMIGGWIVADRQLATREALPLQRRFHGSLIAPAASNARRDGALRNAHFTRPLRNGHCGAANRDAVIVSPVVGLLDGGSPAAVTRRIVGAGDTAIQRGSDRARAHVGDKCLERVAPAFADGDSGAAVPLEIVPGRVVTARDHVFPRLALTVKPCAAVVVALSLCRRFPLFDSKAPAGARRSLVQVGGLRNLLAAAVAAAEPLRAALRGVFGARNRRKFAESLACKVGSFGHGFTCLSEMKHSTT